MDENVTVTVTGSGDSLDDVVEQLRAAGMNVDQVLGAVGIVTGSVPNGRRSSLSSLPGVVSVEAESSFQLAPPDAEIQ